MLLGGLAPYGFGLRTEHILSALVHAAAQIFDVPLSISEYRRGWFSTSAETWLALPPTLIASLEPYLPATLLPPARGDGFLLTHDIRHGPWPVAARPPGVAWLRPVQTLITSRLFPGAPGRFQGQTLLGQVQTTVWLLGAGHGQVIVPAFTTPDDDQAVPRLVWHGLHGDVSVDTQGHHVTVTVQAPGLTWTGTDGQATFTHLRGRTEVTTGRRQPLRSDTRLQVASVAVTPEDNPHAAWAVTGLEVQASTALRQRSVQGTGALRLETLRLDETAYGPGSVSGTCERLFLPALHALWRDIQLMRQDEPDLGALWIRLIRSEELARLLLPVLQTSPALTLDPLVLHTPEGAIQATLRVRVDGNRLLPPGYLVQLLQTIDAEASIVAPVAWVKSTAALQLRHALRARSRLAALLPESALDTVAHPLVERYLQQLEAAAYLVLDGSMYTSQVRYTRGQLWLQGKPVDLSARQDD